jgi:hypothetical protein
VFPNAHVPIGEVSAALRELVDDGEVRGRCSLAPSPPSTRMPDGGVLHIEGVLTCGGLRVSSLAGVAGVVGGVVDRADRGTADLSIRKLTIEAWANEQASIWKDELNTHNAEADISASFLILLGADMSEVDVCFKKDGYLTLSEFQDWAAERDEIVVIKDYAVHSDLMTEPFTFWSHDDHLPMELGNNVVATYDSGRYGDWRPWENAVGSDEEWAAPFDCDPKYLLSSRYWWYSSQHQTAALLLGVVADAWGWTLEEILERITNFDSRNASPAVEIGRDADGPVLSSRYFVEWRVTR